MSTASIGKVLVESIFFRIIPSKPIFKSFLSKFSKKFPKLLISRSIFLVYLFNVFLVNDINKL